MSDTSTGRIEQALGEIQASLPTLSSSERRALTLASGRRTRVVLPGTAVQRNTAGLPTEIPYTVANDMIFRNPPLLKTTEPPDQAPDGTAAYVLITDHGRSELARPVPHEPRLLRRRINPLKGDYTDEPHLAIRDEPEAMDAPDLADVRANLKQRKVAEYTLIRRTLVAAITDLQNGPGADDITIQREIRGMRARLDRIDTYMRSRVAA